MEESRAEGEFSVALSDGVVSVEDIRATSARCWRGRGYRTGSRCHPVDSSGVATQDVDARLSWCGNAPSARDVRILVDFGLAGRPNGPEHAPEGSSPHNLLIACATAGCGDLTVG